METVAAATRLISSILRGVLSSSGLRAAAEPAAPVTWERPPPEDVVVWRATSRYTCRPSMELDLRAERLLLTCRSSRRGGPRTKSRSTVVSLKSDEDADLA